MTLLLPSGTHDTHLNIIKRVMAETGSDRPAEIIWRSLQEAVEVVDRMPDQERNWLRSGKRTNFHIAAMTRGEADATARHRTLAGLMSGDPLTPMRTARNSEEALLCLEWLRFVQGAKDGERLEAAALALLRGDNKQVAAAIYRPGRKYVRTTNYEVKQKLTGLILKGLENQFGITLSREHIVMQAA